MKDKLVKNFIISVFAMLYIVTSLISTIHVIDFFELSNPRWMAISLAIAFELGAAASLASIIALDKMNKTLIWALFIIITAMQVQGNLYFAFKNAQGYDSWVQLFNLVEEDPLYQKRILSFVSGAILPLVALGFIKSLVDYIKPEKEQSAPIEEQVESMRRVVDAHDTLVEEIQKKSNADVLEGPIGANGPDDSTLNEINSEESAESILGLTVEEEPSIETYAKVIKNEDDLNEYLAKRNEVKSGLINKNTEKRNIKSENDARPTGFTGA
jgi:hypothetical protein